LYIAPGSFIFGEVIIRRNSSIWYCVVIRGDMAKIPIFKMGRLFIVKRVWKYTLATISLSAMAPYFTVAPLMMDA
jgi:carbonic anhydrase/acetyltransferase-like protein (isoleucine patch superfamily)